MRSTIDSPRPTSIVFFDRKGAEASEVETLTDKSRAKVRQVLVRMLAEAGLLDSTSNQGISVLTLNLYGLVVELLKSRAVWDRLLSREPEIDKSQFFTTMRNVTDPKDQLAPLIATKLAGSEYRVLLLDGVGLVFPYIRSPNSASSWIWMMG